MNRPKYGSGEFDIYINMFNFEENNMAILVFIQSTVFLSNHSAILCTERVKKKYG